MKKLTILLTSIFLINACSDNQESVQSSESQPMVEYVWMKAGPDFSEENLSMVVGYWNAMIDEMGCTLNANILTPDNANDGFDFIWAHIWTSETARDNCWENWGENYKSDWDTSIAGVMEYDLENVYMFKPTIGKQPKIENNTGSFVNAFYFCAFKEGYSMADLDSYKKALNNTEGFSDYWWYVTLEPAFEQSDPKPDFIWLDIWGSKEDKSTDREIFSQTNLPAIVEDKFNCLTDAVGGFSGTVIRN